VSCQRQAALPERVPERLALPAAPPEVSRADLPEALREALPPAAVSCLAPVEVLEHRTDSAALLRAAERSAQARPAGIP